MAWTDWLSSTPVDHSKLNTGPSSVRAVKDLVAERLDDILYGFISGEVEGNQGVKNLPFVVQGSDPGATADKIKLYSKDVSAKAALFIEDEDANIWQFSQRANDLLSSFSTTVPAGYTDITATYNAKFMRYSTGAVETTGGADDHNHGGTTGAHTLTLDEIPSHTHNGTLNTVDNNSAAGANNVAVESGQTTNNSITISNTNSGGGSSHTHTLTTVNNIPAYFTARLYKRS